MSSSSSSKKLEFKLNNNNQNNEIITPIKKNITRPLEPNNKSQTISPRVKKINQKLIDSL